MSLLGLVSCFAGGAGPTAPAIEGLADLHDYQGPLALVNATVLSMEDGPVLQTDRAVLLRDGRVVSIDPMDTAELPEDARVLDVAGHTVMPGLADMHVHVRREHVPAFLRSGITLVRDLWGHTETLALHDEAAAGEPVPWVVTTGPGIDGSPPIRPTPAVLDRPEDAGELVAELTAWPWRALKVYQNLGRESFLALARAAEEAGIDLVGHVPTAVPLDEALGRMRSIEHLEGYDKALAGYRLRAFRTWASVAEDGMAEWAARTADSGTWNTPTLVVIGKALANNASGDEADKARAAVRLMVRHLHEAGAPLLAGTDAGIPAVSPGGSLRDELAELVASGLTPYEALLTATANPARFLGMEGEIGVVRAGARADLLLVGSNPLDDLDTLRSPTAVILRGRVLVPDQITD